MAGREQQIQQLLQQQGIRVSGLVVKDSGSVISIKGSVADQATKQRVEQVIESSVGTKVANHLEARAGGAAAGAAGGIPGRGQGGAAGSAGGQSYTVKSGDSLSKIAKNLLGDAKRWKEIHELNKDQIPNPDLIHPGQVLRLP